MEQASSKMNFLPTSVNNFFYTTEQGHTVNCSMAGCCGRSQLRMTSPYDMYCETCGPGTCDSTCDTCESTCESTCYSRCPSTCQETCPSTRGYTCPVTCSTCNPPTCHDTCGSCKKTIQPACPASLLYSIFFSFLCNPHQKVITYLTG